MGAAEGGRILAVRVSLLMGPLVLMFGVAALAGIVGLTTARAEAVFLFGTIGIVVPIVVLAGRWAAPMLVVAAVVAGFLASPGR
ncbi:hypothetical protein [Dactylosporangium sp. NPDC006015]|uniref:hypothetical protein n=1 Tax=Dactylosporangium sp. NPDC006015 TaxID=3154576 RepID=UPI0033B8704C